MGATVMKNSILLRIYVAHSKGERDSTHPCYRPPQVVGQILRDWFAPDDVICDPFAGSDTTGTQAERLGMRCFSFEIDPVHHEAALRRHSQLDLFVRKHQ
jgi:DNA modification methylase